MNMPDAMQRLLDDAARELSAELPEGHVAYYDQTPIKVTQHSGFIQVSEEQLMDYGVIPDTRLPMRISRWTRLRWRWSAWREHAGRRIGGWIAGVDLSERDDW